MIDLFRVQVLKAQHVNAKFSKLKDEDSTIKINCNLK